MWSKYNCIKLLLVLLVAQMAAAGTVLHRRTEIDSNGEKHTNTWATEEADDNFRTPNSADGDDGFQTFTRNGITLRIKPQVTTLRVGSKNVSPEQLLEQAKHSKELELIAVRQLLNTGHPVQRTNIENGCKHTSTYTLEPDGSILVKKVEDIDAADVDRRFEEIIKQQQAKQNPNKLSDWEWAEQDKPKAAKTPLLQAPKAPLQPFQPQQPDNGEEDDGDSVYQPKTHNPSSYLTPTVAKRPEPPTDDFFSSKPTSNQFPRLPSTWDTDMWGKEDPFNPHDLGVESGFEDFEFDPSDELPTTSDGQTKTYANTHTDKDGNTVRTSLTKGPNEWRRKTVVTNYNPALEDATTIRTNTLPNWGYFLKSQYNPSKDDKPSTIYTTSSTPKPVHIINIEDLPTLAVLNSDKPVDEQLLHPLGPNAGQQKPIRTLKVENIPPSPDAGEVFERKQVRTFTKTVHGDKLAPSDLDPNMLSILQRAGIKPEDINNANGQTIAKTRVEPGGRTVTTTYRLSPVHNVPSLDTPASSTINFGASYPELTFGSNSFFDRPSVFNAARQRSPSSKHHSASHLGADFTPFATQPVDAVKPATQPKPTQRDREPLGEAAEDEAATLNPLLIHPVPALLPGANVSPVGAPKAQKGKSAIAEFLAKIGISLDDLNAKNGEFVKTIVDDDGRVLTAQFVLSAPKYDK